MADASSSMRPGVMTALRATRLMIRSLREAHLTGDHSYEMSDTAEIVDAVGCMREDYAERETRRGHS